MNAAAGVGCCSGLIALRRPSTVYPQLLGPVPPIVAVIASPRFLLAAGGNSHSPPKQPHILGVESISTLPPAFQAPRPRQSLKGKGLVASLRGKSQRIAAA